MENRRFHFLSVILQIASFFKSWFFPLLLIFVFNFNNDALLWTIARYVALFFIVWSIIEAILTWRTTTYRFEEEQVVLKHGIFSKTRQTIDYDRIQNIQRKTSALHKILGLTTLTLETGATGDDASIELDAIRPEEATEIERKLHAKRKQVPFGPQLPSAQWDMRLSESSRPAIEFTSKEQRTLHFEPTERDTVRATFASLSFFALIPILATLFFKAIDLFKLEDQASRWFDLFSGNWVLIAAASIALLLISLVFGFIITYFRFGRFTIESDDDRVYIQRGIFSEQSFTMKKKNVQGIQIEQTFLKRLFKLSQIKLISVGKIGDIEQEANSFYPFLPVKKSATLLNDILPQFAIQPTLEKLPKSSLWMKLIRLPIFAIIVFIVVHFWGKSYWWGALALFLTYAGRLLEYAFTRYQIDGEHIVLKTGAWTTETFMTKRNLIIEIEVKRSAFQKMFGLCTVIMTNRSKPIHVHTIQDVPTDFAETFIQWYANRQVETFES